MAIIPNEVINDIRQKADIVDIISRYLTVKKKGNQYVAICPFHDDHDPSLSIKPDIQIFKCFVCGTKGNVFAFVMQYEKISFVEAVKKVAQIINYDSSYLHGETRKVDDKSKSLLKVLKDAKDFYHYVLDTNAGSEAKEYLLGRNITEDMIDYFSIGYSPNNGKFTIDQLKNKSNSVESLINAGLIVHANEQHIDRFNSRVMFPIFNEFEEVIGFSGRTLSTDKAISKYVNSPSTPVFNKSRILYNIQNAKKEVKTTGYCYIVEGFMDVIALYKVGIKSAVAIMGTAFTEEHAKILKSLKCELRLCLDGDKAGQHGIANMLSILDGNNVKYRIVDYKGDKRDPDDILNQDGKEALLTLLNRLINKSEFIMTYYSKDNSLTTSEAKKQFIKDVSPIYSSLQDEIERDLFIQDISSKTNVSKSTIKNYLNKLLKTTKVEGEVSKSFDIKSPKKLTKLVRLQRQLFYYLVESDDSYDYITKQSFVVFIDNIYALLKDYAEEMKRMNIPLSLQGLINLIMESNGDQVLIDELIDIYEDDDFIKNGDKEIIDECLQAIEKILSKKQFRQSIEQDSFDFSPVEMAKLIDNRNKK